MCKYNLYITVQAKQVLARDLQVADDSQVITEAAQCQGRSSANTEFQATQCFSPDLQGCSDVAAENKGHTGGLSSIKKVTLSPDDNNERGKVTQRMLQAGADIPNAEPSARRSRRKKSEPVGKDTDVVEFDCASNVLASKRRKGKVSASAVVAPAKTDDVAPATERKRRGRPKQKD